MKATPKAVREALRITAMLAAPTAQERAALRLEEAQRLYAEAMERGCAQRAERMHGEIQAARHALEAMRTQQHGLQS